jgi:hypothetical protein
MKEPFTYFPIDASGDKQKMDVSEFSPHSPSLSYTNNDESAKMESSPGSPSRNNNALVDYSPSSNAPSRDDDDEISVT